jgi:hypothetical protein
MVLTDERSREAFEKVVFDRHFFSTIKRTGLGMCMEFMPDPAKRLTKAELLERNGDDYKREDVSAMWFGWKEAVKLMNPIIIAAGEEG